MLKRDTPSIPCLRWNNYGADVDEKSVKVGGQQHLTTNDGYIFPINIWCGLPYLDMRPYTDQEWEELPHVIITHDAGWDPSILDNVLSSEQDWYDSLPSTPLLFPLFDEQGDLRPRIMAQSHATHASKEALPPV